MTKPQFIQLMLEEFELGVARFGEAWLGRCEACGLDGLYASKGEASHWCDLHVRHFHRPEEGPK